MRRAWSKSSCVCEKNKHRAALQALRCDSGYVGKPITLGVQEIVGEHVSVQLVHLAFLAMLLKRL